MTEQEHAECRDHYESLRIQALERFRGEIVQRLRHELSELVLCLADDEGFDREFALRRVRQLQRWLDRLDKREF